MKKDALSGLTLLNTRPAHQTEALNQLLSSQGAAMLNFPSLTIHPVNELLGKKLCKQLERFHIAIFVSANAVFNSRDYWPHTFPIKHIIAIGPGTENALIQCNISNIVVPKQYNTEGILSLPTLNDIKKKNVIIFCGENSRSLLKATLAQRGATVRLCECYQRKSSGDSKALINLLEKHKIDGIISASKESLKSLNTLLSNHNELKKTPLIVISDSMKNLASEQGWENILLTTGPNKEAIASVAKNLKAR